MQHSFGWPLNSKTGGGSFLYHVEENQIVVGFVVHLNYANPTLSPFDEFQRFKTHPMIRDVFAGGKRLSYGARALTEGGWQSVPKLTFPGGALVGCSAGFMNVPRIKGSHNAILSGVQAADALALALSEGRAHDELSSYEAGWRGSEIGRDLRKVRNVKPLWSKFGTWIGVPLGGADMWLNDLFGFSLFGTQKHGKPDYATLKGIDPLSHAFGAAFDNPGLIVACIVGDGEAETGPLATAWQSNKFLDPITDGAVLPILHLNGFKISNPTILARIEHEELESFFRGCGWTPLFVEGEEPQVMHQLMAATVEEAISQIHAIQKSARENKDPERPRWPMIVLRSPKGWTGPKVVDGLKIEGTFRAHQVPLLVDAAHPDHVKLLESCMKGYKAEELFDANGTLKPELAELAPKGAHRMGADPHANGGILLRDLQMPNFRDRAVSVPSPGAVSAQDTMVLGKFLRDVTRLNKDKRSSIADLVTLPRLKERSRATAQSTAER